MKKILLFALVCFSANLYAQPSLTNSVFPAIGNSTASIMSDTGFVEGPAGANQTWNFAGFTNTGSFSADFVNPAGTTYIDSISGSNYASVSPGSTAYYNHTSSITELLGLGTAAYVVIYSDPTTFFTYPFTFNSTVNDNTAGHYVYGGGTIYNNRTGTMQINGDAYGTITTPKGTFTNVLRVKTIQNYTDITSFSTTITTTTSYTWYSPQFSVAIAQISYTSSDFGTSVINIKSVNYGDVTPSAVANINNLGAGLFIADLSNHNYTLQLKNNQTIKSAQLIDMQGRILANLNCNDLYLPIDLNDLASGIYIVRIIGADNQLYQTKLLK